MLRMLRLFCNILKLRLPKDLKPVKPDVDNSQNKTLCFYRQSVFEAGFIAYLRSSSM